MGKPFNFHKMMSQNEWLERATEFSLGQCIFHHRSVKIVARDQTDGSRKWALKMHEWVLGKDGRFHWEPLPSSRSKEFIKNTRFDSPDEAHDFWVKSINEVQPLYVD